MYASVLSFAPILVNTLILNENCQITKSGGWNKRGGWKIFMKSIGGIFFCGGWNFSKSVSVDPTFIREMRVVEHFFLHKKVPVVLY